MTDPMAGLDAWLEAPYVEASRLADLYEKFVEDNNLDPEQDHYDAYDASVQDEAESRYEDERDEAACNRAEARYENSIYGEN